MSEEGRSGRNRAPPGYYSHLSGVKGRKMTSENMAAGELQNLNAKKPKKNQKQGKLKKEWVCSGVSVGVS